MLCEDKGELKMKRAHKTIATLPIAVLCLVIVGILSLTVGAGISLGETIQRHVISGGGSVKSSSAHFAMSWTVGQPWVEPASSDNFGLIHGFWHETTAPSGYICGDASGDEAINISDAVFLINYIFKGGPAPDPLCSGDVNGDGTVNIGDAVYLINYIFKGGPAPVQDCCP
jgi:hypothetical protein